MLTVYFLRTEYRENPVGLGTAGPRLSWKIRSDKHNVMQTSWRILATSRGATIWDSGEVMSDQSQLIRYAGEKLQSLQRVDWTLTVTAAGETASASAFFETGLMNAKDWSAKWIEPEGMLDPFEFQPSPYLRKTFTVKPGLVSARACQTAHGLYRFWINGCECTDKRFAPGFTSYFNRLQYQVDDISSVLVEGENVWAVRLGDGWWRGSTGMAVRNNFGSRLQFLGQIILQYEDGTRELIVTDENFKASTGGLLICDLKSGSYFDAALEPEGWMIPGFDESCWQFVHNGDGGFGDLSTLVADSCPLPQEQEQFEARPFRDGNGDLVLDFGQNLAGYVRMTLRDCNPGQEIVLEHGEGLLDGKFDVSNINPPESKSPFQVVRYRAKGLAVESFCPAFSVFGFRYVRVSGYHGDIQAGDFVALAVYSDLALTGHFSCSNQMINKLVENCVWSQKGNFLDVPTDCPTRERSPWTGDAQLYCRTAAWFMDVYPFFEKWLQDLACEQTPEGQVPSIIPNASYHNLETRDAAIERLREVPGMEFLVSILSDSEVGKPNPVDGAAGWGDAATIIPYMMYQHYGDRRILENQFESAKKWVDYMTANARIANPVYCDQLQYSETTDGELDANYIWDTGFHWGEWNEADIGLNAIPPDFIALKIRSGEPLIATAYFRYSAGLLGKMAEVLGKKQISKKYARLSAKTAAVYKKYFVKSDGSVLPGRQAAMARVLEFDLCSDETRSLVAERLADAVKQSDYHLNTGFLSTPFILNVLAKTDQVDVAYRLLEQTTSPSWLAPVLAGATTVPECWDGLQKHFGSFNHYSYGAVCDFLFSFVCGIQPCWDSPGFKHFKLMPMPGGSLSHAEAIFESPFGTIKSAWKQIGNMIEYRFEVPANTTATVVLDDGKLFEIGSGEYIFNSERRKQD